MTEEAVAYQAHRSARVMQRRSPLDRDTVRSMVERLSARDAEKRAAAQREANQRAEERRQAHEEAMEKADLQAWVYSATDLCTEIPYLLLGEGDARLTEACPEHMFTRMVEWWKCGMTPGRYDKVVEYIRTNGFDDDAERVLYYWRLHRDQRPLREYTRRNGPMQPLWLLDDLGSVIQGPSGTWPFLQDEFAGAVERLRAHTAMLKKAHDERRAKEADLARQVRETRELMLPPPPRGGAVAILPRKKAAAGGQ
jgi:hypothetical protein